MKCNEQSAFPPDNIYAHSLPGRPIEEWQRLEVHLRQVSECASIFAADFCSVSWAWNGGLLHDLGKATDEFQAYLLRENQIDDDKYDGVGFGRGNHSSAGSAFAEKRYGLLGRILGYLIAGHHAGLPDYYSCDGGKGALEKRLEEGRADLKQIGCRSSKISTELRPLEKLPPFVKQNNIHLWVRMLFSCLVDADRLDTEAVWNPERVQYRKSDITLMKLKKTLDEYMTRLISDAAKYADTLLNRERREVLDACRSAAKQKSGLFSLTVPTGGGKTLAAMTFALDHAIQHNKRRIIYVIPYTSIIEQTVEELRNIFRPEAVIEHHSNLDPEKETQRTRLASENWDAPIIITTNVQFFESLYSAHPSRCRKLHNIINSVIILDEAQLVPPNLLSPCVDAINELTLNYRVTLLLSTATQPALPKLRRPTEIIPDTAHLYKRLQRTNILIPEEMDKCISWDELSRKLQDYGQVLCIVNSRRDCYDLFRLMPEETIHLSALMCGEHRSEIITIIKGRLKNKEPLRVISTQLVEAGVDIDFPVVYRALAGLDSIVQAAGRCNREGDSAQRGSVVVFTPPKPAPSGLLHKGESTTRELCALPGFDAQATETFTSYFKLFYSKVNDTGEGFLKRLTPDPQMLDIKFRSVGNEFRFIDDQGRRPVFVYYGKGMSLIEELRRNGPSRELLRRLQRFTVNVPAQLAEKMKYDGKIEEVWPGFLGQSIPGIYKNETGLDIFRDDFPIEDITGV